MDPAQGDGTHPNKRHVLLITKGMTPIEKNIIVKDDQGNIYNPTYLRRAKGLVKNERARWIDDNTICLTAGPPDENLEDKNMESEPLKVTRNEKKSGERDILLETIDMLKSEYSSASVSEKSKESIRDYLAALSMKYMDYDVKRKIVEAINTVISDPKTDDKSNSLRLIKVITNNLSWVSL